MNLTNLIRQFALTSSIALLAACGGGGADAPPPPENGTTPPTVGVAPTITQQPAAANGVVGATAVFSVAASGTAPITYQWQRNGVAIANATGPSYTTPALVIGDTGATFRAVATNAFGSATSNSATLTVSVGGTPPTLTIASQPSNATVTAGTTAAFTVGGVCSAGTLTIQWQRLTGATFVDIAGATTATFSLTAASTDNGAQFRAVLSCSGQTITNSGVATLTVGTAGAITLSTFQVNGLRPQAPIRAATNIHRMDDGSYVIVASNRLKTLAADLSSIQPLVGSNTGGELDGSGDAAQFNTPNGLAHDSAGNLYVSDAVGQTIRKVTPTGVVTTIAGLGGQSGFADGAGAAARFSVPNSMVIGPEGDLYVADVGNNRIRRVTTAGIVTTYAGTGTSGSTNGAALTTAQFANPVSLAFGPTGDLYVADNSNNRVRVIRRAGNDAGNVETFAGSGDGTQPGVDGAAMSAGLPLPGALLISGNTLFLRTPPAALRAIDLTTGAVSTFAGTNAGTSDGQTDGPVGAALLDSNTFSLGLAAGPTPGSLVAADRRSLRVISPAGVVTTIATNAGDSLNTDDTATGVLANIPLNLDNSSAVRLAVDGVGRVLVSNSTLGQIRRIDANGNVSLVAGLFGGLNLSATQATNGIGSAALLIRVTAMATAPAGTPNAGTLYANVNYGVERIGTDDNATMLTGGIGPSFIGCADGPFGTARLLDVTGFVVLPDGNLLAADSQCGTIRRVDANTGTTSTFTGIFRTAAAPARIDGPAGTARFSSVGGIAVRPAGGYWVLDGGTLRQVTADGTVTTPAISGNSQIVDFVVDPASGTIYAVQPSSGLISFDAAGTVRTQLVPSSAPNSGASPVLGNVSPNLGDSVQLGAITMLGPKQLLLRTGQTLTIVTLP